MQKAALSMKTPPSRGTEDCFLTEGPVLHSAFTERSEPRSEGIGKAKRRNLPLGYEQRQ